MDEFDVIEINNIRRNYSVQDKNANANVSIMNRIILYMRYFWVDFIKEVSSGVRLKLRLRQRKTLNLFSRIIFAFVMHE